MSNRRFPHSDSFNSVHRASAPGLGWQNEDLPGIDNDDSDLTAGNVGRRVDGLSGGQSGGASGGASGGTSGGERFATLADRTYRVLRRQIIHGHLQPGQRLVRRRIGKTLGVSAVPVAEALFKLEQDGLVETAPMYGARVVLLTPQRVRGDNVLREAIECQAARRCAQYADDATIQQLKQAAIPLDQAMRQAEPADRTGMQRHMDFHMAIAVAAGEPSLVRELKRLWFCRMMQLAWINASRDRVPVDWHEQLVGVIAQRDPDAADAAMRRHVRYGAERLLDALQQIQPIDNTKPI